MKMIEDQGTKQAEAFKALKSDENQELEPIEKLFKKKMRNIEIKNKIDEFKKWKKEINEKN